MEKTDLTKIYKAYYTATQKPALVEIEPAQFLSIKGKGDPSDSDFASKVQALYATAYVLKFSHKAKGQDFVVARLEGLWTFDEQRYSGFSMTEAPKLIPRSEWEYRLLIRMPDSVTEEEVRQASQTVVSKKQLPLAGEVMLFPMHEGKAVQVLHVGPFDREPETLELMHTFMLEHKLERNGPHHEIYLSDFTRTAPGKLRTILREPVR